MGSIYMLLAGAEVRADTDCPERNSDLQGELTMRCDHKHRLVNEQLISQLITEAIYFRCSHNQSFVFIFYEIKSSI